MRPRTEVVQEERRLFESQILFFTIFSCPREIRSPRFVVAFTPAACARTHAEFVSSLFRFIIPRVYTLSRKTNHFYNSRSRATYFKIDLLRQIVSVPLFASTSFFFILPWLYRSRNKNSVFANTYVRVCKFFVSLNNLFPFRLRNPRYARAQNRWYRKDLLPHVARWTIARDRRKFIT